MNYNGNSYHHKATSWGQNYLEIAFLPLETFASSNYPDEISLISIAIPTTNNEIHLDKIRVTEMNRDFDLTTFRNSQETNIDPFDEFEDIFGCGKSILFKKSREDGEIKATSIGCSSKCMQYFDSEVSDNYCSKYEGVEVNSITTKEFNIEEFRKIVGGGAY
jgi:hypothetical protein